MPRDRVEEFEATARRLHIPATVKVTIDEDSLHITLPESHADRLQGVFSGDGITYKAAAVA